MHNVQHHCLQLLSAYKKNILWKWCFSSINSFPTVVSEPRALLHIPMTWLSVGTERKLQDFSFLVNAMCLLMETELDIESSVFWSVLAWPKKCQHMLGFIRPPSSVHFSIKHQGRAGPRHLWTLSRILCVFRVLLLQWVDIKQDKTNMWQSG